MKYFNKKRFTMRQVVGLLTVVFLGITVFTYAAVSFTDFTTGTTISSSEMNTKLNALKDAVNQSSLTASNSISSYVSIPGATAVEILGVDFTCPANGFVIAQGHVLVRFNHVTGTSDEMYIKVDKTVNTSFSSAGFNYAMAPSAAGTDASYRVPVSVNARFSCTAGTAERYRINGSTISGGDASDVAGFGTIIVQYSPN